MILIKQESPTLVIFVKNQSFPGKYTTPVLCAALAFQDSKPALVLTLAVPPNFIKIKLKSNANGTKNNNN